MSEAAAAPEGGKKKGGKMPMIIVLAAVLGAGGFFGMKSRGPSAPPPIPEPELGTMVSLGDEFIVNLQNREYFVRTKVAVQLDKKAHMGGGDDGHGGKSDPPELTAFRDIVVIRLNSLTLQDLSKPDFYAKLKYLLAQDMNHAMHMLHAAEDAKKEKEKEKDSKDKKSKKKDEEHAEEEEHAAAPHPVKPGDIDHVNLSDKENADWDSDEGPVLKVYFNEFATMRE